MSTPAKALFGKNKPAGWQQQTDFGLFYPNTFPVYFQKNNNNFFKLLANKIDKDRNLRNAFLLTIIAFLILQTKILSNRT